MHHLPLYESAIAELYKLRCSLDAVIAAWARGYRFIRPFLVAAKYLPRRFMQQFQQLNDSLVQSS
jgi:hypothetical protein